MIMEAYTLQSRIARQNLMQIIGIYLSPHAIFVRIKTFFIEQNILKRLFYVAEKTFFENVISYEKIIKRGVI